MKYTKTFTVNRDVTVCNRCRSIIHEKPNCYGGHEYLRLNYRAGPESIFGMDGYLVQCDLCEQCIKKVLGKYLVFGMDLLFKLQQIEAKQ